MSSHAVSEDGSSRSVHSEELVDYFWQLLGDVGLHIVVLLVVIGRSVQVESSGTTEIPRVIFSLDFLVLRGSGASIWEDESHVIFSSSLEKGTLLSSSEVIAGEASQEVEDRWWGSSSRNLWREEDGK